MAKLQTFGDYKYLLGKISRSNFYFRVHWLSENPFRNHLLGKFHRNLFPQNVVKPTASVGIESSAWVELDSLTYKIHHPIFNQLNIRLMERILHQLIGSLSHYLHGFIHPSWCRFSSINSIKTTTEIPCFKGNSLNQTTSSQKSE